MTEHVNSALEEKEVHIVVFTAFVRSALFTDGMRACMCVPYRISHANEREGENREVNDSGTVYGAHITVCILYFI